MKAGNNGKKEENMKQALPYLNQFLEDSKISKSASYLHSQALFDKSKFSKAGQITDIQYLHAAANVLSRNSARENLRMSASVSRRNISRKCLGTVGGTRRYHGMDQDEAMAGSANIIERNKYHVSKMSEWKEIMNLKSKEEIIKTFNKISIDLRHFYSNKKDFLEVFEEIDKANIKMSKIIEIIQCYRTGIATKMQKIMEKYQKLIEVILTLCFEYHCKCNEESESRKRAIAEATKDYEDKRKKTDDEIKVLHNLLKARECELRGMKKNEEGLEAEVKNLREMLQIDVKEYQEVATEISHKQNPTIRANSIKDDNKDLTLNLETLKVQKFFVIT